jgi:hypothetical protein
MKKELGTTWRRRRFALVGAVVIAGILAAAAYATLPSSHVDPSGVTYGVLAGQTSMNIEAVDAFTRAINQADGTNVVITHNHFPPCSNGPDVCQVGGNTLWHMHAGPNLVVVVGGQLTLENDQCRTSVYTDGQGFATGLEEHRAWAGPNGADFYSIYFLPADATDLRTPPAGFSLDPPKCAS